MSKVKLGRADAITIAASAVLVVAAAVGGPLILKSSVDGNIVAKADALQQQCDAAYEAYDNALSLRAVAYDVDNIGGVVSDGSTDASIGVVVPEGSDVDAVMARVESAGLDPLYVVQDVDGAYVYLIQPGDTLTDISRTFGYSVDRIANYNEIRNVNLIYANSSLRIPSE